MYFLFLFSRTLLTASFSLVHTCFQVGMDSSQGQTFHLFGDLCVSDPQISLLPEDQGPVGQAISLIRDFAEAPPVAKPPWDIDSAHQQLVNEDIAWWRARNVNRPKEYIVRPSGSIDSSVACILFNPTFSVKDPHFSETFDTSNATMAQLERAGFNLDNTFFVDQGRYSGIEVFLELTANRKSMKRFVLFVKHPSYFFYIQSDKDCARKLRRRQGRPQDLALEVAAKLGRIHIEPHFYESSPKLRVSLSVPREVTMEREAWKGEAAAQLQRALPSAILSQEKSHRIRGPRRRDQNALDDIVCLMNQFNMGEVRVDGPILRPEVSGGLSEIEIANITQRHLRLQKINAFWNAFRNIIEESGSLEVTKVPTAEDIESCLTTMEDMVDFEDWQDLPSLVKI
ncbi:hypothetical protein HFD88_006551 [Aspergillus terreus]|nr:hypothetical protein HFD88_006551 [Aspergillus terreus]